MKDIMQPEPHNILSIVRQTAAEYTFRVEFDGTSSHGQFFQLSLPKIGEAPISISGRGDGYVEFTIRKVGRLTDALFSLRPGTVIFMRGPYGHPFPVEQFENKNLVVITSGTGLAPVKTMITHFYDHPEICKEVYLIAGFKDSRSVLFNEERENFAKRFHTTYCLSREEAEGYETGRVTKFISDIPFSSFDDVNVVIVGAPAVMASGAEECIKLGVPAEKIWVSFERKMSCAVGKCGHCKINETYVCLEGPVFNYTKARELFD